MLSTVIVLRYASLALICLADVESDLLLLEFFLDLLDFIILLWLNIFFIVSLKMRGGSLDPLKAWPRMICMSAVASLGRRPSVIVDTTQIIAKIFMVDDFTFFLGSLFTCKDWPKKDFMTGALCQDSKQISHQECDFKKLEGFMKEGENLYPRRTTVVDDVFPELGSIVHYSTIPYKSHGVSNGKPESCNCTRYITIVLMAYLLFRTTKNLENSRCTTEKAMPLSTEVALVGGMFPYYAS